MDLLTRLVVGWPEAMRRYLFDHLGQILALQQQQQQQQQEQQRQEQQRQEQQRQEQQQQQQQPVEELLRAQLVDRSRATQAAADLARHTLSILEDIVAGEPRHHDWMSESRGPVQFAIYSPQVLARGSDFTLDLWAFLLEQRDKVETLAKRMGQHAMAEFGVAGVDEPTVFGVEVRSPELEILRPRRMLVWKGQETVESFECKIAKSVPRYHSIHGLVTITISGLMIANIRFSLLVQPLPDAGRHAPWQTPGRAITAFASYASENRIDVLRCLQGIQKGAPYLDIFIDIDRLRSGDDWLEKVSAFISTSDVMYLFWSTAASRSRWVTGEWKEGLQQKGLQFIDPCPLESPELVPPPPELAALHFHDRYLIHLLAQQHVDQRKGPPKP
ncbi:MAG TPA: TIR domain-containing protein [Kofleriaceae bacterium]|nr:TIR domain-containing protein [Kofleriaceae bacterium]